MSDIRNNINQISKDITYCKEISEAIVSHDEYIPYKKVQYVTGNIDTGIVASANIKIVYDFYYPNGNSMQLFSGTSSYNHPPEFRSMIATDDFNTRHLYVYYSGYTKLNQVSVR